ncbi:hypothetical protein RRF57_007072 [Xylaria bambusicola]|uniref:DUF7791 domain-containing protein n=1 Tax=Xylaria bambusicola TaxID=326684 RepID=A0AAN7ZA49_9PEZI
MQDFTKADMTKYVKEYLEDSDKFRAAAALDSKCLDLIPNISDRANGVWLWVYLVVRDILRDIRDGEPFQHWQDRLESYPQELVVYFRKMMERIDPFHRKQGAEIFLLALAEIGTKLPMIGLSILYDEDTSWCGIDHDGRLLTGADLDRMYMAWQPRLQNRCRDLMRLRRDRNYRNECEYYVVGFLHRTVKDFLQEHYIGELRALVSPEFSEPIYLARLTFAVIEQAQLSDFSLPGDALGTLISRLFCYLREEQNVEEERQQPPSHFKLADAYDNMMVRILAARGITNQGNPYTSWVQLATDVGVNFTHVTIQFRLRRYSLHRLQAQGQWSRKQAATYMECALRPVFKQFTFWKLLLVQKRTIISETQLLDPKLVAGLVELGMDPNMHLSTGETAWACFLHECTERWLEWSSAGRADALDAIQIFLRHGAKTNVVVRGRRFHNVLTDMVGQDAMADWKDLVSGGRAGYGTWISRALASPFRAWGTTN